MKHLLTCINCPNGCDIEVETAPDGALLSIQGYACRSGEAFARQEMLDPQRRFSKDLLSNVPCWPMAACLFSVRRCAARGGRRFW